MAGKVEMKQMKKETILTYLEQQLTTQLEDYDTTIEWDTKNHAIVLEFTLFAENSVGTD